MPASSTTRLSCISPQRPRTAGARSARTRLPVSDRKLAVRLGQAAHQLGQASVGLAALALELLDLGVHAIERFLDRLEQSVHGGLPRRQRVVALLAGRAQFFRRQGSRSLRCWPPGPARPGRGRCRPAFPRRGPAAPSARRGCGVARSSCVSATARARLRCRQVLPPAGCARSSATPSERRSSSAVACAARAVPSASRSLGSTSRNCASARAA